MVIGAALQPKIIVEIVILIRQMIVWKIAMVNGVVPPIRINAAIAWKEIPEQSHVHRTAKETGGE